MSIVPREAGGTLRKWTPYGTALLAFTGYLFLSGLSAGPGLPLDDGWIHQTYARNVAQIGQLAFAPGAPSAGSTAPLWTLLLALGHLLRLPALAWAYTLGAASLLGLVWAAMRLWRLLWPAYEARAWVAGTALALSWPLLWAAGSGMETLLFIALGFVLLTLFLAADTGPSVLGVLAGLLILARPDGLILVVLLAAAWLVQRRWRATALLVGVAALTLLPYFAFNLAVSGDIWPNTFYAKQVEYATLLERPLLQRALQLFAFSLGGPESGWRGISGAHLVLLPGLLLAGWRSLQADLAQRRLWRLLPLLWAGGHVMAYAVRLPVTYQHGRYLWAALPVWILYGLGGWAHLLSGPRSQSGYGRVLVRTAGAVYAVLLIVFLSLGALAYTEDVAFVQNEMVDVALWLRDNTPEDALVAAHDIGALGYFARRPLLDLAGLVTPEVIPLLQDEGALARYVLEQEAAYLVTAPGWPYHLLSQMEGVRPLYDTRYPWTREQGLNNMVVYKLDAAGE